MIRLHRKGVAAPADWEKKVRKALPKWDEYSTLAMQFELLDLADLGRKGGFTAIAAHLLKKRKGTAYFPNIWSEAKPHLEKMSYGKCAYCEHPIDSKRSGQVEHFKPKSLFPSLAYDWSNYFLACAGCNGAKSDQWPESGSYVRPDEGDPFSCFVFDEDGSITAVTGNADAELTIVHFDLDRKLLGRHRKTHIVLVAIEQAKHCAEEYKADPEVGLRLAKAALARLSDPKNFYSAALTQCFLRVWNRECPGVEL